MVEPPRRPNTGHNADHESPPRMPRWVKVGGIIVGVLIALLIVLKLAGVGGQHGPGQHLSVAITPTPPVAVQYVAFGKYAGDFDGTPQDYRW